MAEATGKASAGSTWVRWIGRVIVLLWALFWVILWIRDGIPDIKVHTWTGLFIVLLILAVVAVVMVFIAWYFDMVGGVLLVIEAIAATYLYYSTQELLVHRGAFTYVCMASLPLIAGILLIISGVMARKAKPAAPAGG